MLGGDIQQASRFPDSFHHFEFLADAVYEVELHFREKDGQGDAWETAAGTDIDHFHAFSEFKGCGDGEGVQHMFLIEAVDVFAGNDIDLCIPVLVQFLQGGELLQLYRRKVRKV